jgi:hypothetical protein
MNAVVDALSPSRHPTSHADRRRIAASAASTPLTDRNSDGIPDFGLAQIGNISII